MSSGTENVRRRVQITSQTGQAQTPSAGPSDKELLYLSGSTPNHCEYCREWLIEQQVEEVVFNH